MVKTNLDQLKRGWDLGDESELQNEIPFADKPLVLPSVSGKSKGKEAIIVSTTVQHYSSCAAKLPISLLRVLGLQNMSLLLTLILLLLDQLLSLWGKLVDQRTPRKILLMKFVCRKQLKVWVNLVGSLFQVHVRFTLWCLLFLQNPLI